MNRKRKKMQNGSLRKVKRADNDWAWKFPYHDPVSGEPQSVCLSKEESPTEAEVQPYIASFADCLNLNHPLLTFGQPKFRSVFDRFIKDERLNELKKRRPVQESQNREELSYTTASSYLSVLKTIRARRGKTDREGKARARAGMAQEHEGCPEVQGQHQGPDASPVRKGDAMGIDSNAAKSDGAGRS